MAPVNPRVVVSFEQGVQASVDLIDLYVSTGGEERREEKRDKSLVITLLLRFF